MSSLAQGVTFIGTIDREFAHYFYKYLMNTYLLSARHAYRVWGYNSEENRLFFFFCNLVGEMKKEK